MFPFIALTLGSQLVFAQPTPVPPMLVADAVPKFNVEPSCRAVAMGEAGVSRDVQSCLADENAAREDLVKQWNQFSAADRARCTALAQMGGEPSYVQLFECLDLNREAAKEREDETKRTTGQNPASQNRAGRNTPKSGATPNPPPGPGR
jgi:hypothetical protein